MFSVTNTAEQSWLTELHPKEGLIALASNLRRHLLVYAVAGTATARSLAQGSWPRGPIRIVVSLPPGGAPDAAARQLAASLAKRTGQVVIVENKGGASGQIGLKAVAMAPADGLTLAYITSANVTADLLSGGFDLRRELAPVTMDGAVPYLVLVNADAPYRTLADLVAAAKAAPDKLAYGSGGSGSALHLGQAQFFDAAGIRLLHVPYKGGVAAIVALGGGEIDVCLGTLGSANALLQAGRVRVLAVAAAQRLALLPSVPTVREAIGLPFEYANWAGYAVRSGTPPQIVAAVLEAITEAAKDPAYRRWIAGIGGTAAPSMAPQAFADVIHAQYISEAALIKRLGIKAE